MLEGMEDDATMEVLRRHFHESHALQCGFCTPGMLMMARDILLRPLGNTIYVMPPYCIEAAELASVYAAIDEAVR